MEDSFNGWTRHIIIKATPPNLHETSISVEESFGNEEAGLGSTVWDPSYTLAYCFDNLQLENSLETGDSDAASILNVVGRKQGIYWQQESVLELGSGLGLLTLSLITLGASVTASDRGEEMLFLLRNNISQLVGPTCTICENQTTHWHVDKGFLQTISLLELDWNTTGPETTKFNHIVAGECLYDNSAVIPLLTTAHHYAHDDSIIWICGIIGPDVLKTFLNEYQRFFSLIHQIKTKRAERDVYILRKSRA
jgi:hypothetical protein